MDKQEAIKRLEELDDLMDKFNSLQPYLNGGYAKIYAGRSLEVSNTANALPSIPDVCVNLPMIPAEVSEDYLTAESTMKTNAKKSKIALIAAGSVFVLGMLIPGMVLTLTYVTMGCLIAAVVFSSKKSKAKKVYDEGKAKFDAAEKLREKTLEAFRTALTAYDQQREKALAALADHAVRYEELREEYNAIDAEYMKKMEEAQSLSDRCVELIRTYDFVPTEYLHLVKPMIGMLKSGRADDYKEALNLAITEEREEQERQERRAAEARQAALEERRAEEERRHNQQMEAQQRAHNAQMEKQAAQAEHDRQVAAKQAERDARNAAFQQHADLKKAATHRCNSCANNGRCNIKYSDAAINCAAFRPR